MLDWGPWRQDEETTAFYKCTEDEHGMAERFRELWTRHPEMETLRRAKENQVAPIATLKENTWK